MSARMLALAVWLVTIIVQEIERMNEENSRLQERLKQIESQVCLSFSVQEVIMHSLLKN